MRPSITATRRLIILGLMLIGIPLTRATTDIGPWIPMFKGIDHMVGTNTPGGGGFPELQVVHTLRIDLSDPDVRLFSTPPFSNYVANVQEVGGFTVSDFLARNNLQVAINGATFQPQQYYLPAGTPMDVDGLSISDGLVVSTQNSPAYSASIVFDATNRGTIIPTNWPAIDTTGILTAVSGEYPLLVEGFNVGSNYFGSGGFVHSLNPRTAYGLSQDGRYLFLMTIDGRQPGYSDGAYDYETGEWMRFVGAYDAVNMDGGGSTTLVVQDSTGVPVRLNMSSAVADSGRERTVGSHFGVFAKPLPGFINDVVALPGDTIATIMWTTLEPSTTQVQYDVTTNFANSTTLQPALVTNHTALITGLTPDTGYYFRAVSAVGPVQYVSPDFYLTTTNYLVTNLVFEMTNSWSYTAANLDNTNWTSASYDDSSWSAPGPGLLWVDVRTTGPNPDVQPKNTEMPTDPSNNGFPYPTYYFRTHFTVTNALPTTKLLFSCLVDDGAVFYLNGTEIHRLRMDPAPALISNGTLANAFPCAGDATCLDEFAISGDLITNLVSGVNVLAVEVHNYSANSPDITFGISLVDTVPYVFSPQLEIAETNDTVTLSWSRTGFTLQQTDSFTNSWSDVPGPITTSPFVTTNLAEARYYRLRGP